MFKQGTLVSILSPQGGSKLFTCGKGKFDNGSNIETEKESEVEYDG